MKSSEHFNFIILGGGAAAFAGAIKANELGARTAIINYDLPLGGTCVNVGCVPSKAMLYFGEVIHLFSAHGIKGISSMVPSENNFKISFQDLVKEELSIVASARQEKYEKVLHNLDHVSYFEGKGKFISSHEIQVNDNILSADKLLIATGSKAQPPPIEGIEEVKFLTHIEALKISHQPKSLIILGAGPVGLEFAQMYARLGTKVTILYRRERILPNGEPELAERLEEILQAEGIEIIHNAEVRTAYKEGKQKFLAVEVQRKVREIKAEEILIGTGKVPNTAGLGLEKVGVQVNSGKAVITKPTLETSVPYIYAAGDVTNLPLRLETTAGKEGTLAALNALTGSKKTINYYAVPAAIFTDPQYSWVGFTDKEALEQGYACSCRVIAFDKVPKAQIIRRTNGMIKMVLDTKSNEILGVHVLAPHSGDFIFAAALAIQNKMTLEEFLEALPVFPTLSESLKIVAQSFVTDISKLSCCV